MFISLMTFWGLLSTRELISTIIAAFGFLITFVVYIRTYQTVRRYKNHIQSMQIRDEAQSEEIKNLTVLIKSTVGIFYVYLVFLVCCLPYLICMAVIPLTLMYLNSSLNPVTYCWKMRHVHTYILRKMSWNSHRPFRLNYNRSSSVVHIDN